jgi:hypothetical protein
MVDQKQEPAKPEKDPFVETHKEARDLLRKRYNEEIKRASAAHLDVQYAQSQIDYDKAHRPENTKDIPGFEIRKTRAMTDAEVHEELAMKFREALKALGEVFADDETKEQA